MDLDRAAVERVLKRASALSPAEPGADAATISEEALVAAALEVGLDPGAVQASLAVERLGPAPPRQAGDQMLGAAQVVVERVVDLDATTALQRLDELIVREHQLRTSRSRPNYREWRRREGTLGRVQRAAKSATGDRGLCKASRVEATVSPIDAHRCVVRIVVDRRHERANTSVAAAAAGGGIVVFVAAGVAVATPLLVVAPVAAVAAAGVAATGRARSRGVADRVDGVLEGVAHARQPVTLSEGLRIVVRSLRAPKRVMPR